MILTSGELGYFVCKFKDLAEPESRLTYVDADEDSSLKQYHLVNEEGNISSILVVYDELLMMSFYDPYVPGSSLEDIPHIIDVGLLSLKEAINLLTQYKRDYINQINNLPNRITTEQPY